MKNICIPLTFCLSLIFSVELFSQQHLFQYAEIADSTLTYDEQEIIDRFENSGRVQSIDFINASSINSVEDSGRVLILLPDRETEIMFHARNVEVDTFNNITWNGILLDNMDSTNALYGTLTYLEYNALKFGYFTYDTLQYEIHSLNDSITILISYDSDETLCGVVRDTLDDYNSDNPISARSCTNLCSPIDVLVVYTRKGADENDMDDNSDAITVIENTIRTGIALSNNALLNSKVYGTSLRLIGIEEVGFQPSHDVNSDVVRLATSTTDQPSVDIRALRENVYSADLVIVLVESSYSDAYGAVNHNGLAGDGDFAYGIVQAVDALQNLVFTHEICHLFSCHHQNCGLTDPHPNFLGCDDTGNEIAHGYDFHHGGFLGIANKDYKTIMDVKPRITIPYFSNPNIKFKGHRIGSTTTAYNAEQILNRHCEVAEYRGDDILATEISDHFTSCLHGHSRVVLADVCGGSSPYTYNWYLSLNGINYGSSVGSSYYQEIEIPEGLDGIFVKLVVMSADNQVSQIVRFIEPCQSTISPFQVSESTDVLESNITGQIITHVYPNPVSDGDIKIKIKFEKPTFAKLYLTSVNAPNFIPIKEGFFQKGITEMQFDISDISSNLYLLKIVTNDASEIIKLVKI